jgi:ribosomal protein L16 Arg81 hydroxylase
MIEPTVAPIRKPSTQAISLVDLLAPLDTREFLDHYWDQRHLVISRNDPAYYGGLLSAADVDRTIAAAREAGQDNLTLIPPPDSGRKIDRHLPGSLSLDKAYNAFHAGDTVRLMALHRTWPPLAALAESLSADFSANINMNFYLTPPGSQGFDLHVDTHDVFVLQVEGSKEWSIYEPQYRLPVYTLTHEAARMTPNTMVDEKSAQLLQSVVLETGDFLYMPRGFPHKARATKEHSLHITIGIHILYWVDFLKALVEGACLSNEALRRSLPPGYARNPDVAGQVEKTLEKLLDDLKANPPLSRTLETLTDAMLHKQRYPADGHFATLLALDKIGPESVVERRGHFVCRVSRDSTAATIRFAENHVKGPASIGSALEFVRDATRQFRVRDLPGPLSNESKVTLVRRLVREGLLRPV